MSLGHERLSPRGFSLLELVLALLLFQVGLLAVAGMALTGQQILRRSHRVFRGTLEAQVIGDSLFRSGTLEDGERIEAWGRVRWEWLEGEVPSLRILALGPHEADTLALLRIWPPIPEKYRTYAEPLGGP